MGTIFGSKQTFVGGRGVRLSVGGFFQASPVEWGNFNQLGLRDSQEDVERDGYKMSQFHKTLLPINIFNFVRLINKHDYGHSKTK